MHRCALGNTLLARTALETAGGPVDTGATMLTTSRILASLGALLAVSSSWAKPADPKGLVEVTLKPTDDTWTTHDDPAVHGLEPMLKVGIERQACLSDKADNICTKGAPKKECCPGVAETPAWCAPPGECATATPAWDAYRKFRSYLRFDLATVPKGTIVKATLRMRIGVVTEKLGGPVKVVATRLKKIGSPNAVCGWSEATLNDTDGTTWSSLPQNVATEPDGKSLLFDVTKAVRDWLTGDTDYADLPLAENCGFHLYDPDFGKADTPLERQITFSAKEGDSAPSLIITVAQDLDADGVTADLDCNESSKAVHPGAADLCQDGVDSDCSGSDGDEVCDGLDNDCDGQVDEGDTGGVAPCGPGRVCANHSCVTTCKDACSGPFDTQCVWDAVTSVWVVHGCTLVDGCHVFIPYQACNAGQMCEYGSCSFNCLDDCDAVGAKGCQKDAAGIWHTVECGNVDVDACLEWKDLGACKPGATCTVDGGCGAGGCNDACPTAGEVSCTTVPGGAQAAARVCLDSNGDGCLDLDLVTACASGECKAPLGCVLPGATPPPPDAGPESTDVAESAAPEAVVIEPVVVEMMVAEVVAPADLGKSSEPLTFSEPMDYPPDAGRAPVDAGGAIETVTGAEVGPIGIDVRASSTATSGCASSPGAPAVRSASLLALLVSLAVLVRMRVRVA